MIRETEMYVPIKNFFNSLGFKVKAEIRNCDVVAYKADEPLIIIELKTQFSLKQKRDCFRYYIKIWSKFSLILVLLIE